MTGIFGIIKEMFPVRFGILSITSCQILQASILNSTGRLLTGLPANVAEAVRSVSFL